VSPKSSPAHPFDSIESAHEFVALLHGSTQDALAEVQALLDAANGAQDDRRVQALNLAHYKITQLSAQMQKSRRILNDLRSIRILLFQERNPD
jgi:hypothetical protein